ncbi:hypothetical protein BD626DRAFT_586313 [Schizophyllum amplum]|uniref:BTB domain-containing protein n=1 Tax=Schizophyllum amplum TaxID=97359 RepID=A0A550C079_9AGAR|nr:hypothetical protein BD626DRAFT_586313 [Auriculariopsis ampla]
MPCTEQEDLWFPDGNVVIRVGERLCRVYKGFLVEHSPVLADMFSFTQPGDAETVEGLPLMAFPDDPDDVMHWLKSMLLPGYFEVYPHEIGGPKLLAVLRLSHKYDVAYLRQRALRHLDADFPSDVDSWKPSSKERRRDACRSIELIIASYFCAKEIGSLWLLPGMLHNAHCSGCTRRLGKWKGSYLAWALPMSSRHGGWKYTPAALSASSRQKLLLPIVTSPSSVSENGLCCAGGLPTS